MKSLKQTRYVKTSVLFQYLDGVVLQGKHDIKVGDIAKIILKHSTNNVASKKYSYWVTDSDKSVFTYCRHCEAVGNISYKFCYNCGSIMLNATSKGKQYEV